ncbi:MAG: diguanylate cyclase [Desulfuromonadales bacterium]|nr:diguanylate cyclase [Desulfuromonadales bacterium]
MRILIAEDDLTSRTILSAVVKKWGYVPVAVTDGEAAWEAMQKEDAPQLALLDWNMPGLNGLEVCGKLREIDTADPPYIIFLTSRSEKDSVVEGLEAGANDYVIKPHDNAELLARVRVGQRMLEMQAAMNAAKKSLTHEAMHDPLTRILNRRAILDFLQKELSRAMRHGSLLSIGMIDLDYFKRVNDRYGHQTGDDVLCGLVRTIQENLRDYDLVGRYGGEEFLVVAPCSSGGEDDELYERLRAGIAGQGIATRSGVVSITVSIGVVGTTGSRSMDDLLADADSALYRAKKSGRNCVVHAEKV